MLLSLDAGLFFDRPWQFAGRSYYQTLEPRLFYVYVPFRDQSKLPNFSTAEVDFGTNALFRENRFIGGDRVGDANQVTMAVTSRLVEPDSGLERLKATLGQIYYFEPQRVTLDAAAPPQEGSKSDLLALVSGQVTPSFAVTLMTKISLAIIGIVLFHSSLSAKVVSPAAYFMILAVAPFSASLAAYSVRRPVVLLIFNPILRPDFECRRLWKIRANFSKGESVALLWIAFRV